MTTTATSQWVTHHPHAEPRSLTVELSWTQADPFTVKITFRTNLDNRSQDVDWELSRDLLAAGLCAPAGDGDIRIAPSDHEPDQIVVDLRPADSGQHLRLLGPAGRVRDFLTATYAQVAPGTETVDVDRALTQILEAAK